MSRRREEYATLTVEIVDEDGNEIAAFDTTGIEIEHGLVDITDDDDPPDVVRLMFIQEDE